jgi:hypothetical protein
LAEVSAAWVVWAAVAVDKNKEKNMAYFNPNMIAKMANSANTGQRFQSMLTKVPLRDFPVFETGGAETGSSSMPSTGAQVSPGATSPSFMSELGEAWNKVAPDMFRGIAAGLASYQGDPSRPLSGVGEAMAATMQRGEQTREARRKMSLMPEEAAAVAKSEVQYEKIKYEDDKDAFRALREMEGFRMGVPTDSVSKGLMAYTAANPFSAVERQRMDDDLRQRLTAALRISY